MARKKPSSKTSNNSGQGRVTSNDVKLAHVVEREKTIRIVWIGLFVTIGLVAIVVGVVKALDKPPWLTAMIAIIGALIGPSGVITVILRTRKKYVDKTHRRTVELEERLDRQRESSQSIDTGPATSAPQEGDGA